MKIIEQIKHATGSKVALDTELRLITHDTDIVAYVVDGRIIKYTLTVGCQTAIKDKPGAVEKARKNAAKFICRELYGEVIDRLFEIMLHDFEKNYTGDPGTRDEIEKLIRDLQP